MSIDATDFVVFCKRSANGLLDAADRLDPAALNTAPDLPNANTPAQLVVHALTAAHWWAAHIVCGHDVPRDRDGEFEATATHAELHAHASSTLAAMQALIPELDAATELAHEPHTTVPLEGEWTVGAALFHAYEELAQHLGHLEITVDVLLARADAAGSQQR